MIPIRILLLAVIALIALVVPPWCHGLGEETALEKTGGDNSSRSQMDVGTVNAIVSAINQSLLEFRSMSALLSARLEHVEKTLTDIAPDTPARIFMATHKAVKAFSWSTNDAITIKRHTDWINGVAYDPTLHKLYWCSTKIIFRGDKDDDEMETVFDSGRSRDVISDGNMNGLAFDWITSNLYGVSANGIVFACNTTAGPMLECIALLSGQGNVLGIALNPIDGKMYLTRDGQGYIYRADMDGTNIGSIVSSLSYPTGIVVDYAGGRLYWTDRGNERIQSSDLQGNSVRTITTLANTQVDPWGIVVLNDRIYASTTAYDLLVSMTNTGEDIRTLYDGPQDIRHLVLATSNLPSNRTNDCESLNCPRLCVLKGSSATCIF